MDTRKWSRIAEVAGVALPVAVTLVLSAGFSRYRFATDRPATAFEAAMVALPPFLVAGLGGLALYWVLRRGDAPGALDRAVHRHAQRIGAKGMGALALCVGLAAMAVGAVTVKRCAESARWPSVEGQVESSRLLTMAPTSTRTSRWPTYAPEATVAYKIGDRWHRTTTIRFGLLSRGGDRGKREAEERLRRYHPGARVPVYYDPSGPERAVLEPGVKADSFFSIFLGSVFLIGGRFFWKLGGRLSR